MKDIGKYGRSVSILGVGCTPFMDLIENEEMNGLTEGELYGYAAIAAMKDAGIGPKDLQYYIHGQAGPIATSDYTNANVHVNDWFGARGLGSISHSEACCTGYFGLDLAAQAVASGKYDFVLTGSVEMGLDDFVADQPAYKRQRLSSKNFGRNIKRSYDRAYTRYCFKAGEYIQFDDAMAYYKKQYGFSDDYIDDALNALAVSNRRAAALNPLAERRTEYAQIAKEAGYDDVMAYMRSDNNRKVSQYLRRSAMEVRADGAAACIVCPTEIARQIRGDAVEIRGIGNCVLEAMTPHLEIMGTREICRQAFGVSDVRPEEIDLVMANDFFLSSSLVAAEESGYIPKGQAWQYAIDGRTAFDGDKPINTNGGRCSFGHAHAASGFADIYEAVMQMRGEAGAHQVKKRPRRTFIRGFGGGAHNLCGIILGVLD